MNQIKTVFMKEQEKKLYMVMLGCTPKGRFTEQHDIFFGIGSSLQELIPHMKAFWPEAKGKIHIDAWREVTTVDNYSIQIINKILSESTENLFFINLGGYKENEFDEYHYKTLAVAESLGLAAKKARATTFYKHFSFEGATSHIDDKYGIDVDDIHKIEDVLAVVFKDNYSIKITKSEVPLTEDVQHIGYLKIDKIV
jgi:hypothetical protein